MADLIATGYQPITWRARRFRAFLMVKKVTE